MARAQAPFAGRERTLAWLAVAGALVFGYLAADVVLHGPLEHADGEVEDGVVQASRAGVPMWTTGEAISAAGSFWVTGPLLAGAFVYMWSLGQRRRAWMTVDLVLVAHIIVLVLKYSFDRATPDLDSLDTAFPSGHTAAAVVDWGFMLAMVRRAQWAASPGRVPRRRDVQAWGALIIVVASGRVMASAHWMTDVLAGASVGITLWAAFMLLELWWTEHENAAAMQAVAAT